MTENFTPEDIQQMRKDGDLRAFIRSRSGCPPDAKADREFPEAAPPASRPDGRPVGAWPARTHRAGCSEFGLIAAGDCCATCGAGT